jgi:hypothetical protein
MVRRLRTALLWLSFLALPLQGMAGTLMLMCMTDGHDMMAAVAPAEYGGAGAMPAGSMTSNHDDAAAGDSVELPTLACDVGSVCFASVALPASPLDLPAAGPAIAPEAVVAASHVSFFTGGPDRPPRPAFA